MMKALPWMLVTLVCMTLIWGHTLLRTSRTAVDWETTEAVGRPEAPDLTPAPPPTGPDALVPQPAINHATSAAPEPPPALPSPVAAAAKPAPAPRKPSRSLIALNVDKLMAGVRQAVGSPDPGLPGSGVLVQGTTQLGATLGRFSLMFNPKGCYLQEVEGPIKVAAGFDGRESWALASTAEKGYGGADITFPEGLISVFTGRWAAADAPCTVREHVAEPSADSYTVCLAPIGGAAPFYVEVDRFTSLPRLAYWVQSGARDTWKLTDYRRELGVMLPHRLDRVRGTETDIYEIDHVGPAPAFEENPYQPAGLRLAKIRMQADETAEVGNPDTMRG